MKDKQRISSVQYSGEILDDEVEIPLESNQPTFQFAFQKPNYKSLTTNESHWTWKSNIGVKRKLAPTETASSTLMKHSINTEKKEKVDEIYLFFDTMKTVKTFFIADKLQVKRKIFYIVTDLEGKYVGE